MALNCWEAQLSALLQSLGFDLQLAFVYCWRLDVSRSRSPQLLGDAIISPNARLKEYIEQAFPVQIEEFAFSDFPSAIEHLAAVLRNGTSTVISVDTFWCPWDPGFQKYHHHHALLSYAIDKDRNEILCDDFFHKVRGRALPLDLYQNCVGSTFYINPVNKSAELGVKPALATMAGIARAAQLESDAIANISRVSEKLAALDIQLEAEVDGYEEKWWASPLFSKLLKLEYARKNIAYAFSQSGEGVGAELAEVFQHAARSWSNVRLLLLRAQIRKFRDDSLRRASTVLNETAELERTAEDKLRKLSMPQMRPSRPSTISVPLNAHFNSKAFGSLHEPHNFDDDGRYFSNDEIGGTFMPIVLGNHQFHLANVDNLECDNVACRGQQIFIKTHHVITEAAFLYTAIAHLPRPVRVRYSTITDLHETEFTASHWLVPGRVPPLVSYHRVFRKNSGRGFPSTKLGRIYSHSFPLKRPQQFQSITLPDEPALRVFAIELTIQ